LAVRKNIRDEFLQKCEQLQARLTDATGDDSFQFIIDWESLYNQVPADSSYRHRLGEVIYWYMDNFTSRGGEQLKKDDLIAEEFLERCSKRQISVALVQELGGNKYNDIKFNDGIAWIVTTTERWAMNSQEAGSQLVEALSAPSEAISVLAAKEPVSAKSSSQDLPKSLSLAIRKNIRDEWLAKVSLLQDRLAKALEGNVYTFPIDWAGLQAKIPLDSSYVNRTGEVLHWYMDAFVGNVERLCSEDEMCREAFIEATEKREILADICDKIDGYYNDTVIKDGTAWVVTIPDKWGYNAYQAGSNLVDKL